MTKMLVFLLIVSLFCFASCQSKIVAENSGNDRKITNSNDVENNDPEKSTQTASSYNPTFSPIKASELKSRIGNVEAFTKGLCFKIENPGLKPGDKVQIIITELPQKTALAEVVKKEECERVEYQGELDSIRAEHDYILKEANGDSLNNAGYGIGLVNPAGTSKAAGKFIAFDIDNDKSDEYFRECTSNEGLHLTVWKGKPLTGKRIWHSYYHFGYDTEPDCKEKDYEGTDNE